MSRTTRAPAVKRVVAAALLGSTAVDLARAGPRRRLGPGPARASPPVVGVGAAGFARRSVLAQVLARGIAWVVLAHMRAIPATR